MQETLTSDRLSAARGDTVHASEGAKIGSVEEIFVDARVMREPVDRPVTGAEIGEQEVEVLLREEEAVVGKETVAKDRIALEKDVEVEREAVSDEVCKERVEVEGEIERRTRS